MRRPWGRLVNEPASALRVEELLGAVAGERETAGLSVDEAALIDRCLSGDDTAFDVLVDRYQDMVYNLALRLLGKPDEALDLSQEVFFQIYRKLATFRRDASLRTWVYRIVINLGKNRQRWWRRREREMTAVRVEEAEQDAGLWEMSSALKEKGPSSPHDELHRKELGDILHRAIADLPFDQRTILLLKEIEGLSYEEIARTLGLALGTVKSRLARARKALRERLEPELAEL